MNRRWLAFYFFLLLPTWAQAWPSFDRPDFIETEWTADDMVYNGVRMYIENIHCDCQYEKILNYYRKHWAEGEIDEKGFVENDLGELKQISRGDEKYFFSVQVKADPLDAEKSVGRLVITELPGNRATKVELGGGIPMVGNSEVVSDISDSMPGKRARTVVLLNEKSIVDNMDFYRMHYENAGWSSFLTPVNPSVGSQALSYRKDGVDINIAIHEQAGASVVLFNEVKSAF
ncbi:MAG: hypothetical protein R3E63_06000 [Pseudomonadales bacterium]